MARLETGIEAPDFEIDDLHGRAFRLSGLRGRERAVLVFNRGFV
jgi:peroxiredoxin